MASHDGQSTVGVTNTNCKLAAFASGRAFWHSTVVRVFTTIRSKSMSSAWKKTTPPSNTPPDRLASQSTQQPQPVCTWSARASQSGQSRSGHTVTATTTAPDELFLFGGYLHGHASSDLYVISTRDFSTTLLQTSGELPAPRYGHGAALTSTTLLICGGIGDHYDALDFNLLYLLNLGTSHLLTSSLTPVDHSFALQFRESGPAL